MQAMLRHQTLGMELGGHGVFFSIVTDGGMGWDLLYVLEQLGQHSHPMLCCEWDFVS